MPDLLAHYKVHYNPERHHYSRFGVRLDSVSSCLPYLSSDWLDANPQVLKKAEGRGHRIATFVEKVEGLPLGDLLVPIPSALNSNKLAETPEYHFLRFKEEAGFRALVSPTGEIASELFVYHDLLDYVGRLDLVGVCENLSKDVVVIDVKATALLPKTVGPQTAGYFEAYNRNAKFYGLPKAKKRAVLWLTAKTYKYLPLDNPLDWPRFVSRLTDTRWARELGYRVEWKPVDKNGPSLAGDTPSPESAFT